MKHYFVFIRDEFNRDNQAFTKQSLPNGNGDIYDMAYENGWDDATGDLLVIDQFANNIDEIYQTIHTAYPNADPAIFRITECENPKELTVKERFSND